jgi:hypothetical protein
MTICLVVHCLSDNKSYEMYGDMEVGVGGVEDPLAYRGGVRYTSVAEALCSDDAEPLLPVGQSHIGSRIAPQTSMLNIRNVARRAIE